MAKFYSILIKNKQYTAFFVYVTHKVLSFEQLGGADCILFLEKQPISHNKIIKYILLKRLAYKQSYGEILFNSEKK